MQLKRHLRASDRWLKMDNGDWARACLEPLVENESGESTRQTHARRPCEILL